MNYSKLANISIIFMGSVLFFAILKEFASFLRPFFIAIFLTLLLVPITRISKEKKILILLNTISTIIIIFVSVSIIGSLFFDESQKINTIEQNQNNINEKVNSLIQNQIIIFGNKINLNKYVNIDNISNYISSIIKNILFSTTDFFKEFFLILLFLMFIMPSFDTLKNKIEKRLNTKERSKFRNSIEEIEKSIRTYLFVKTLISIGTAIVSGIIMFLFNVQFYIIFMIMIFLLNFIPNIGSLIAVLVVIISYFIFHGFGINLIILSGLLILTQIIFGNILEPKIAGRKLELSPVIILLSLFFWGYIWGIVGMLFAVPLISIIKIILSNIDATKKFVIFLS